MHRGENMVKEKVIKEDKKELKKKQYDKKNIIDQFMKYTFLFTTILGSLIIVLILYMIVTTGIKPFLPNYQFGQINLKDFLLGNVWSPSSNKYGVGYIIVDSIYITILSVIVVVPISVLTALFIAKIASKRVAYVMRTVIEILASIPSVIYGLFGAALLVDFVKLISPVPTAGGLSTLSAVLVLSMMVFPIITSIAETSISSVPHTLEEASLALGATKVQTNFKVVLTSAKSGIFAGIILGVGRAVGEATAVSLVAGNALTGPTYSLFHITRTLTTTMLMGIHDSTGLQYDIRFSVALVLMIIILIINALLNLVKNKVGNFNE